MLYIYLLYLIIVSIFCIRSTSVPSFTSDAQVECKENTTTQLNARNLSDAFQDELEEFDAILHEEDQIYQRNFFILRVIILLILKENQDLFYIDFS